MKEQKIVPAGTFKAKCLALLDQVNETGEEIIITKYGKPVARIAPVKKTVEEVRENITTKVKGDIVSPLDAEDWGDLA